MALIKSISGIRGTIGGRPYENLTPLDTVIYVSAFASWLKSNFFNIQPKVVVGRDARISGPMIQSLVNQTFAACGIDVFDLGLSTTPTVEISVIEFCNPSTKTSSNFAFKKRYSRTESPGL